MGAPRSLWVWALAWVVGSGFGGVALGQPLPVELGLAAADSVGLAAAQRLKARGEYGAALERLAQLGSAHEPVARLWVEALADIGDLPGLVGFDRSHPGVLAQVAAALIDMGRYTEARAMLTELPADHVGGRLVSARLALAAGDWAAARRQVRGLPAICDSSQSAAQCLVLGQAAWLRGEYQAAKSCLDQAVARGPGWDRAHLALARLYAEKYESKLARRELRRILGLNSIHPDALVALARVNFTDGHYRAVTGPCEAALDIHPQHLGALELVAKMALADGELHAALATVEEALVVAPEARIFRALRAACAALAGDSLAAATELADLEQQAPADATPRYEVAGVFDRLKRYREAASYYEEALEVDGEFAPAANALGLLWMRDGREAEARRYLDLGFALDRYNIRSHNMRKLFKLLDGYERYESPHFVIKADSTDVALAPLFTHELELIRAGQVARFGYEPQRLTTIEIFPQHQLLSARLVGLPGVQGIPAACFGPVIATDSPQLWGGRQNWRVMLEHEFGHTIALGWTEKRVPHWFTEGLSVVLEERAPPVNWHRLAKEALRDSTPGAQVPAFNALDHGFTRSRSMVERNLAYYKSAVAVSHLIDTRGWEVVGRFLDDFAQGYQTPAVLQRQLGESAAVFGERVDALFAEEVATAPIWESPTPESLRTAIARSMEDPEDPDRRAEMAVEWVKRQQPETALSEAVLVLDQHPDHALARFAAGCASAMQGEWVAVVEHLEGLVDDPGLMTTVPHGYIVVRDLGRAYAELGEDAAAVAFLTEAVRLYPSDPEPYRALAAVHTEAARPAAAARVLSDLLQAQPTEFDAARDWAEMAETAGDLQEAIEALRRALWIHPLDREVLEELRRVSRQAGDGAIQRTAVEVLWLAGGAAQSVLEELVELTAAAGLDTARRYAEQLLARDPGNRLALDVLRRP